MPKKEKGYKSFKKRYPTAAKVIKYGGTALNVATKAYGIAKTIAALVNAEIKTYQVVPTTLTVTTTAQILNMVTPVRGTGVSERVGDSIAMKSLLFKSEILWNSAGVADQGMRIAIVVDKNTNASADWNTVSDLFQSAGTLTCLRSINNRKRFKVLSDTVYYRDTSVNRIECKNVYTRGIVKKTAKGQIYPHHISFQGANSYGGNNIYLVIYSNVAANAPQLGVTWEGRFIDN